MTSKFKALTDPTPPLSSDASTEERAQQSKRSVGQHSKENQTLSMPTLSEKSKPILPTEKRGLTTEQRHLYAMMARVVLSKLESSGLIKRYKVLSADGTWKATRYVFDNTLWDETLDLKVLSNE